MRGYWILDVLADLKSFATANDLTDLAEQLDDTAIVALAEISALEERTGEMVNGPFGDGEDSRIAGKGGNF